MNKRDANDLFVIRFKMSDLQENLDLRNLCHQATTKVKSYCNARYPTRDQVKKLQKRNGSMD